MRIERAGECVEEDSVGVSRFELRDSFRHQLIAMDQFFLGFIEFHVATEIVRHLKVDQPFDELFAALFVFGMPALVGIQNESDVGVECVVFARQEFSDLLLHSLVASNEIGMELFEQLAFPILHAEEHATESKPQDVDLAAQEKGLRGVDALDVGFDGPFA